MFNVPRTHIDKRLANLEEHLARENPILLAAVKGFRELDRLAYRMGLLTEEESFATRVPWWPLVSILGTFSSGKSTFINSFIGLKLQRTGNQAVDDKFTVLCFSREGEVRTLPGIALDADPRFPFYQISAEINAVSEGEGARIDSYLQLRTCPSERLRGKIVIDSPGFDADAQRTSTLRITDHIIDLSDLVLVFFDARHPEPGAMQDTLNHLVSNTIHRPDSNKFLYILNQIDTAAQEDNPEEVVAAWQRALSQTGLTAGRFYQIYDKDAARPIDNESLRARFESKRDADLTEIHDRIQQVEIERAYRVIGVLEHLARRVSGEIIPKVQELLQRWRRLTLLLDSVALALFAALLTAFTLQLGVEWSLLLANDLALYGFAATVLLATGYLHWTVRAFAARRVEKQLSREVKESDFLEEIRGAFRKSVSPWRSALSPSPAGWGLRTQRKLSQILADTDQYVQNLNDRFTNPSGRAREEPRKK